MHFEYSFFVLLSSRSLCLVVSLGLTVYWWAFFSLQFFDCRAHRTFARQTVRCNALNERQTSKSFQVNVFVSRSVCACVWACFIIKHFGRVHSCLHDFLIQKFSEYFAIITVFVFSPFFSFFLVSLSALSVHWCDNICVLLTTTKSIWVFCIFKQCGDCDRRSQPYER